MLTLNGLLNDWGTLLTFPKITMNALKPGFDKEASISRGISMHSHTLMMTSLDMSCPQKKSGREEKVGCFVRHVLAQGQNCLRKSFYQLKPVPGTLEPSNNTDKQYTRIVKMCNPF